MEMPFHQVPTVYRIEHSRELVNHPKNPQSYRFPQSQSFLHIILTLVNLGSAFLADTTYWAVFLFNLKNVKQY